MSNVEMDGPYFIGVDLGTTGTKTAIFNLEGNLLADAYEELELRYPRPGWVEQEPDDFYESAVNTIRASVKRSKVDPREVKAIAFDSQMAGTMGIDKDWKPVTHYDSWLDSRCKKYVDLIRQEYEDLIIERVGTPPSISHGPKILWWKNERPAIFEKIHKFVMPNCYVAGRMASLKGEDAFIDYTFLHFTGFYDAKKTAWSEELCQLFDISVDRFPTIVEPWRIVGEVSAKSAGDCGLVPGIPLVAGSGDQAAGSLGAGIVEPGMVFDSAGTASVFACCVDRYKPDKKFKTIIYPKSVIPGLWLPLSYIGGGGLCLRWFRDELAQLEKKMADGRGISVYELLDDQASRVAPGSEDLVFIPHFGGRTYPSSPDMRGVWFGLNWKHKKSHLYRSILESIAYEYRFYMDVLRDLLPDLRLKEARVIGGGAKSDLWNQIKSDVLQIPYVRLNREEFGALGLAITAGYGVGVYKNMAETAKNFTRPVAVIKPRSELGSVYKRYAELYLKLMQDLEGDFQIL